MVSSIVQAAITVVDARFGGKFTAVAAIHGTWQPGMRLGGRGLSYYGDELRLRLEFGVRPSTGGFAAPLIEVRPHRDWVQEMAQSPEQACSLARGRAGARSFRAPGRIGAFPSTP